MTSPGYFLAESSIKRSDIYGIIMGCIFISLGIIFLTNVGNVALRFINYTNDFYGARRREDPVFFARFVGIGFLAMGCILTSLMLGKIFFHFD